MLPSLLARDIQEGLKQFLITGFEPSDDFFHGLMRRFVEKESAWMKGPFLQVGLPFRGGAAGTRFFDGFETQNPSYTHQEAAWQRLDSRGDVANTLVATGTGSGKTECFLYPVLDHCARGVAGGAPGIKALVIYPMNALATDQARRFAEVIAGTPAFAGLRVGLFVGGNVGQPGSGMVMSSNGCITDRDTLRKNPPDVLLTNYKMLDYLLLRPKDRKLWARNTPTTLRYVVVDELHTFDGAQGTDLALLLRRLRARLEVPKDHVVCVGTSATLGGTSDAAPLREYARQLFASPFPASSVVTENRLSVAEFIGEATIEHVLQPRTDLPQVLDATRYARPEEAVAAWFAVFFPDQPAPPDVRDPAWRVELGERLKRHLLFVNLLKLMKGGVVDFAELQQSMQGPLPAEARPHIREVLDAVLVLAAWARAADGAGRPLVTLRVQVWMRELRRMVAKVTSDGPSADLRSAADLSASLGALYLPLVQCSECHTTGWLSRIAPASNKASDKLEEIYNTWFARRPEAVRLYPGHGVPRPHVDGVDRHLCASCGSLQGADEQCQACGDNTLVPVFQTTGTKSSTNGTMAMTWHDATCPACGGRDRLLLLGARNATLGAQVVEHSWASPFNDDKKLIAFSDSVQDAAHRAGFFGARTYGNTVRTALAKAIDHLARPTISWAGFLDGLEKITTDVGSPLEMTAERLVAEFIGPNMTWQHDWVDELLGKGALPKESRLPDRVRKRLAWQAVSEFTYLSHRGRNLDRIGKATLAVPIELILQAAKSLAPVLREQYGVVGLSEGDVAQWVWGFLAHLRRRGAVWHPELATYATNGKVWELARLSGRSEWMPAMGDRGPRPVLLSLGKHPEFDKLSSPRQFTWFDHWAAATLGRKALLGEDVAESLYVAAISDLEARGVFVRTPSDLGDTLALSADCLLLQTEVVQLSSGQGKRKLTVPADAADALSGMPCLDATAEVYDDKIRVPDSWFIERFSKGDLRRVIASEHTGLLERPEREALETRFKSKDPKPWFENLLSATPTLELGVDIGDLSSVLLCSVPPTQASYLQRIGRAGRRDGNAITVTLADGGSPHDLYFFEEVHEMLAGEVTPPGIFLKAAEVLRRQLFAFCLDDWVGSITSATALPDKTSVALDAVERADVSRFPYIFTEHVLKHEPRLLQAFVELLGEDIDARVTERLTQFMRGTGDDDGLRVRLMKALEGLVEERKLHKKRAEQVKAQIATVNKGPQDEATKNESDQLKCERDKALVLVKEINQRELLNTLTDAGLIPNYAFPEAGIELKSVLWRRKGTDDHGDGAYVALPAIKYERPANSALSEFAPENRFYANQRRVEIDQINMGLAKLESWRLCPSCHHMQNLEVHADALGACPRCGDAMWSDQAQRRQLLRFKQAIANSDDTKVRIDDSADDREPKFYVRQLLADFTATDIKEAWRLDTAELPFGFEFISHVTFRDVNFGELSKPGDTFKVADQETARPGFKLCRHCGKVQTPPRHQDKGPVQQHSFECAKRKSEDPADLVDCLYLYREFSSEALRILVPYTRSGMDAEVIQSFMAALQLGLKIRFGGRVDHLRMVLQDEPGHDEGPRRQFVMLYDSVPGGTGYLHQLLTQDAGTLADVLRMALTAINGCRCNADPEKDGCYRCLFQYRLGRKMELVSRNRAREVLTELVEALGQLQKVATISDIFINPNFDSVLEARFIESLRRLGGIDGLPPVKLVQEIVYGKSGFLLEVGSQRYWVEPQRDLGPSDGVAIASRPDFTLWPAQSKSARRPIAVFCDGWAYHKDSMRADAAKRSALVSSGSFWVWSVTHDDVKAALDGDVVTDLDSPLTTMNRHSGTMAPESMPRAEQQAFGRNAVAQLLRLLATEPGVQGDAGTEQLRRNAGWATFLMVPTPGTADVEAVRTQASTLLAALPEWMHDMPTPSAAAVSRDGATPSLTYWWPAQFAVKAPDVSLTPGVLLIDDQNETDEATQHQRWRRWLALFNTMQVLPGFLLATREGIDGGDCELLSPATHPSEATAGTGSAEAAAWAAALELAVASVRAGLVSLEAAGAEPPVVGYEHADGRHQVVAEAELAWPAAKVAVLLESQSEYEPVWVAAGWKAIEASEGWADSVRAQLDLEKGASS